ncbi:MAG: M90 family metallopeptidase [Phycisphaerales bacterium]
MFFRWFRRRRIRRTPFPPKWRLLLHRTLRFWADLSADEQARMEDEIRFFIAERNWEGCGGLELDESMQVLIAAQACRLLLGRPNERFSNVSAILVYPSGYFTGPEQTSVLGAGARIVESGGKPVLGQAHQNGPVILSWSHTVAGAVHDDDGENVVLHEFAHKLDMMNGVVDGTPRMDSAEQAKAWHEAMTAARERLQQDLRLGLPAPLRPYALTNPGEFFAVSTEVFFERPDAMAEWDEELYRVLAEWYRQDPLARRS